MDKDEKQMGPTTESGQEIAEQSQSSTPQKYDSQEIARRIAMQKKRKEEEKKEKRNRIIKTVGGILAIIIIILLLLHSCGDDRPVTPTPTNPTTSTVDPTAPIDPTDDTKPGTDEPVHEHEYVETVKEATCLEGGYTYYACECGDTYKDNSVEALGHKYKDAVVAPTCTAKGYTTHTCERCNHSYKDKETNAVGHKYSEKKTTPTCTTEGYITYTCKCGHSYKGKQIPAYGHNYKAKIVNPTYEAGGYTEHTCIRCNDSYKDDYTDKLTPVVPHTHTYKEEVVAPTCTSAGYTKFTCACGESYTGADKEALGHNYKEIQNVITTCTTDGYVIMKCERCGDEQKLSGDKAYGHAYVSKTTDATCTTDGYTTHTCNRCGDSYTDGKIDAYGHNYQDTVVDPTCTTGGYTTHTCGCGDSYTDSETAALGHNYKDTVVDVTHETDGYVEHVCDNCGDSYKDGFVEAIGHNYSSVITPPTCMDKGYTTHSCGCGDEYVDSYVDALGHDYQLINKTDATCTTEGSETYQCSRCTSGYVTNQPANGHNYISETTAPTCTEDGYTTHTCDKCGDNYTDSYVDALGCEYVFYEQKSATCLAEGYTAYKCYGCGDIKKENIEPQLEHDYVVEEFKMPSCTEQGYTKSRCSNGCEDVKTEYSDKITRTMVYASLYGTGVLDNAIKGYTTLDEITIAHPNCANSNMKIQVENNKQPNATITSTWNKFEIIAEDETSFTVKFTSNELDRCVNCPNDTHVPAVLAETCKYCGEAMEDMTITADNKLEYVVTFQKHEHDFKVTFNVEPSCDEDGYIKSECECGAVKEEYPEGGHDYTDTIVPPTKNEQGYTEHICENCGDSYRDNYVDAIGYGNLLMAGEQFNGAILSGTDKIVFTNIKVPEGVEVHDFSAMQDRSVIGWYGSEKVIITPADPENGVEEESVTYAVLYVTSEDGEPIIMNESCANMFANQADLIAVDFSNVTTAETKYFTAMFKNCTGLTELDLTMFEVANIEEMSEMFYGCSSLRTIKTAGSWDTGAIKIVDSYLGDDATRDTAENMFTGCVSLVGPERSYEDRWPTNIAMAQYHGYFTYELPADHKEETLKRGAYTLLYCTEITHGFQDEFTIYYPWFRNPNLGEVEVN